MRAAARVTGAAMSCRSRCQPVGPVTSTTCRSPVAPSWSSVSLEAASCVDTSATVGMPGKSCTRRRTSWTALGGQRCTERRMPSTGRSRTARTASGTLSRCRRVKQPWPAASTFRRSAGRSTAAMVGRSAGVVAGESGTGPLRSGVVRATLGVSPQQRSNRSGGGTAGGATLFVRRASNPMISLCGRGPECILKSPWTGRPSRPFRTTFPSRGARG